MAFGYEFVTLNSDQKHERRFLLDLYGEIAQWSGIAILVVFQACFLISWLATRTPKNDLPPKSPSFNKPRERATWLTKTRQRFTKLDWWLRKPAAQDWGTRGEWVFGGLWTVWLLFLCVNQTGNDYLHLTKRFGIVGASQLPFQYLCGVRSPYNPIQLLTRLSHEQLKATHQVLGRIVYLLFVLHSIFYMNFFILSGFLAKRIKEQDVIFGIVSIAMFTILYSTALQFVRRRSYKVFYMTHLFVASLVIWTLFFHVSHLRPYIVEVVIITAIERILRAMVVKQYAGTVKALPGTNLVEVRIPLNSQSSALEWKPGQHVYLLRPSGDAPGYLASQALSTRQNPFTVASIPLKDRELLLVSRTLNGNTKHLAQLAKTFSTEDTAPSIPLTLEGPYGHSARLPDLRQFEKVLLIAGGVGATFVMPIYRSIIEQDGLDPRPRTQVRFIWAVRKLSETQWAFPKTVEDQNEIASPPTSPSYDNRAEVFVTRPSGANLQSDAFGDTEDIELAEDDQLLTMEEQMEKPRRGVTFQSGRPKISAIVDTLFARGNGRMAVIACGPKGLMQDLRNSVEHYVGEGYDVYWHEETFGW